MTSIKYRDSFKKIKEFTKFIYLFTMYSLFNFTKDAVASLYGDPMAIYKLL